MATFEEVSPGSAGSCRRCGSVAVVLVAGYPQIEGIGPKWPLCAEHGREAGAFLDSAALAGLVSKRMPEQMWSAITIRPDALAIKGSSASSGTYTGR
ncbi:MAG: hypothetical protein OXF41_22365 [bacterium]|nr:hypothetical protein [bacterium]